MFMLRAAEDEFKALLTAEAIEDADGTVISITFNGRAKYQGAIDPHSRFVVWARIESKKQGDKIDDAIDKKFKEHKIEWHTSYPVDPK